MILAPVGSLRRASRAGFALLLTSVLLVSVAQLALKLGMLRAPAPDALLSWSLAGRWLPLLALGALCYGSSMLAWLGALARLPVSVAYPMLSLSFLLVAFGAAWLPGLAESLHPARGLGVVLVVLGNAAVAWSASADAAAAVDD